jgi:hypothetical protein
LKWFLAKLTEKDNRDMIVADVDMKRDMDLIRKMLLVVEKHPSGFAPDIEIDGYTQEQIGYHATLLGEAGLAEIINQTTMGDKTPHSKVIRLTWAGHEFLDAARDNTTWNQAKDKISKIGGATLPIWIAVLTAYIKSQLGI